MNIEFHYTIAWLVAARAGLRGDDLRIFSCSSQYTDDNDTVYVIKGRDKNIIYQNRISQTMNILKPREDKLEVYPLFHFIPGNIDETHARRADGKTHPFNTVPNSRNANRIMDEALASDDLYQIGIAAHAYVDTWAHQNFTGSVEDFNAFSGFWKRLVPNCGHADAVHKPDLPRLEWQDTRLIDSTINNKQRFLDAAAHLFDKLWTWVNTLNSDTSSAQLSNERQALIDDLRMAIGSNTKEDSPSNARMDGYRTLAEQASYGSLVIPVYDKDKWKLKAVRTRHVKTGGSRNQRTKTIHSFHPNARSSDWFRFQEAVKEHAVRGKAIICENPAIASEYKE